MASWDRSATPVTSFSRAFARNCCRSGELSRLTSPPQQHDNDEQLDCADVRLISSRTDSRTDLSSSANCILGFRATPQDEHESCQPVKTSSNQ